MSRCLSLAADLFSVKTRVTLEGVERPWETLGYREEFLKAKQGGGFFDLSHFGIVEISGPDAADYLNRMSTANFKTFSSDKMVRGAFLTGRGQVISMGFFEAISGGFHYWIGPNQAEKALEHLEKFHFSEEFTTSDRSVEWAIFGFWNLKANFRAALGIENVVEPLSRISGRFEAFRDDVRPELIWIKVARDKAESLLEELSRLGVPLLGERLFHFFRIRAAIPLVGREIGEKEIILEGGFESPIARNKGCYPGQEVVERIYTYGQVNKRLTRVELKREPHLSFPQCPISLTIGEKQVGTLVSYEEDPLDSNRAVGLAYLQKHYWEEIGNLTDRAGLSVHKF